MSSRYDIYIYIYIYIYFWPKAKCTLIHSLWPECPRPVARILTAFCLWPEQAQPLAISLLQLYRKNITYYVLWLKVGPGGAHQCCFFSGLMTSPLLFLHQPEAHSELPTAACHALLSQSPHDRVFAPCAVCSPHASQHGRSEYRNRRPLFPPHCQEDCTRNSQRLLNSRHRPVIHHMVKMLL